MRVFTAIFSLLFIASCSAPAPTPAVDSPSSPNFVEREVRRHVHQLRHFEMETSGLPIHHRRSIESYFNAVMHGFNMQPAFGSSYVIPYHLRDRYPRVFTVEGHDAEGRPIRAGGLGAGSRSATGRVAFNRVIFNPNPTADLSGIVAVVAGDQVTGALLEQLHDARAAGVIIAGSMDAPLVGGPFPNMLVVHGSRSDVANLLGLDRQRLTSLLAPQTQVEERTPTRIALQVARDYSQKQPLANLIGFVAGKIPTLDSELVIVCAEYDGFARAEVPALLRGHSSAAGASAVLELARKYGQYARFGPFPERTVMFALWSGSSYDHAGLRSYLQSPAWPAEKVHHIIWLGAPEAAQQEIEDIVRSYGHTLTIVSRRAPELADNGSAVPAAEVQEALRLAREAAALLYREARALEVRGAAPVIPTP